MTHSRPRGRERIDEPRHARVGANVSMTLRPRGRKRTLIDDRLLGDAPYYARFGFSAAKTGELRLPGAGTRGRKTNGSPFQAL